MNQEQKSTKPYSWVPTLYLAEALPYAAVMLIAVLLYQEKGLSDQEIALYTGFLGLPWVIKPLWSPFIDNIRTKRWWILTMQLLGGAGLASIALTLNTSMWLQTTLAIFMLIAFASATHDIAADGFYILGLSNTDQELYVGVRNTFYRIGMVLGQGGLVMLAGYLQSSGIAGLSSVDASWSATFLLLAALMIGIYLYHTRMLPSVEQTNNTSISFISQLRDFARTWVVFFSKPHIVSALCFILLFRLPEGLLTKIVPLFLKRSIEEGGLALNDMQYGMIYGTIGVIGLLAGGIIGGWLVSRYDLRRCLWPLVLCITLPDVVYVYLSYTQTASLMVIGTCICIEQIGYGLGFAAYTLYLVSFSRGERSTSVFSLCTAFQYLGGIVIPGMVSGFISDAMGYQQFFICVMGFCLVTFLVTAAVKVN